MERFYALLAERLEEDTIGPDDVLREFETWDSLTALTVVVMISKEYRVMVSGEELAQVRTARELFALVEGMQK
jgi:acyl carrier protein